MDEIVDKRKHAFTVALVLMIWMLASCSRDADGSRDLKGTFYPLDLALACDESTPSPIRSEYPAHDSANAFGNVCVERNSVANGLKLLKIRISKDRAFREPVYEIELHVGQTDRNRMKKGSIKAMQSRRTLVFIVHGSVVARAFVSGPPIDGVVMMGGYNSADEAEAVAARFRVPLHP